MRFKHPSECNGQESTDQSISLQSSNSPSNDVQEIEERRDDSSRTTDEIHERRRGSATRKSYTVEFKKKTLHLLDSLSNSRNKWKKVAEAKQINKCLIVKWNKARDKIFAELSLNKRSANAGGVRASRQRRKMVKRPKIAKDIRVLQSFLSQSSSSGEHKEVKSPSCGLNLR